MLFPNLPRSNLHIHIPSSPPRAVRADLLRINKIVHRTARSDLSHPLSGLGSKEKIYWLLGGGLEAGAKSQARPLPKQRGLQSMHEVHLIWLGLAAKEIRRPEDFRVIYRGTELSA